MAGTVAGPAGLGGAFAPLPARKAQAASASSVAITEVTVIDATGAPPGPSSTVIVEEERIAAVMVNGRLLEKPALDALVEAARQAAATPIASPSP
jgi:hypothetical protein